jgi:hypothetical protein
MHNECKFSQLRYLKLMLLFENDVDSLNLVSFLMSAPFIEILEIDVSILMTSCLLIPTLFHVIASTHFFKLIPKHACCMLAFVSANFSCVA